MDPDARPLAVAVRALKLGDLLVAVPALRALRRGLPGHRILLATSAWLEPIVELVDAVDGLLPAEGLDDPLPLPPEVADVAVNLHGNGPESRGVVHALAAARVLQHRPADPPAPAWRDGMLERARWVRLLDAYGMPGDPDEVGIRVPAVPSTAPGAAVLHVGAFYGCRRWPVGRFAAVARALEESGERVVLTGSTAERPRALEVARAAGLDPSGVLAGGLTLDGVAAVIAGAGLVISADTGAAHLASAYGIPSVVLFGPAPPEEWGPPPGPHVVLTHPELRRGDAFADALDPALAAVTVEEVLAAVASLPRAGV